MAEFSRIDGADLRKAFTRYNKGMHDRLSIMWSKAIMAYTEAAITDDAIQVDTGMSATSMLPMMGKIKKVKTDRFRTKMRSNINSRIGENRKGPARTHVKGNYSPDGTWNPSGVRSAAEGTRQGRSGHTISYGNKERPIFTFQFSIQPYQWKQLEDQWDALLVGEAAFFDYVDKNLEDALRLDLLVDALTPKFI